MSLAPVFGKWLVRLLSSLIGRPAASVSTILYFSDVLPRDNENLQRLVCDDLLHYDNNYLFRFLIAFLRCFC